jgi:hypothetical protein
VYEAFVSLYLNLYIYMFFPFQDSAIAKCWSKYKTSFSS